jgi:hypothetical protein
MQTSSFARAWVPERKPLRQKAIVNRLDPPTLIVSDAMESSRKLRRAAWMRDGLFVIEHVARYGDIDEHDRSLIGLRSHRRLGSSGALAAC